MDVDVNGCRTREDILARDLANITKLDDCRVATGTLHDLYAGTTVDFVRETRGSKDGGVQIYQVVVLSNAWKSGANGWTYNQRVAYANDPYVLLAVVDQANQDKRDYVADERRPSNTPYQCDYVARQIGIKNKYKLTVTGTEHDAMNLNARHLSGSGWCALRARARTGNLCLRRTPIRSPTCSTTPGQEPRAFRRTRSVTAQRANSVSASQARPVRRCTGAWLP